MAIVQACLSRYPPSCMQSPPVSGQAHGVLGTQYAAGKARQVPVEAQLPFLYEATDPSDPGCPETDNHTQDKLSQRSPAGAYGQVCGQSQPCSLRLDRLHSMAASKASPNTLDLCFGPKGGIPHSPASSLSKLGAHPRINSEESEVEPPHFTARHFLFTDKIKVETVQNEVSKKSWNVHHYEQDTGCRNESKVRVVFTTSGPNCKECRAELDHLAPSVSQDLIVHALTKLLQTSLLCEGHRLSGTQSCSAIPLNS
ncbi:uncharacterized protein LOC121506022 [Cheilinus undulatus]|uniref:uncharacterized protein LOC121506022 n=1 Tax=Cheilinus undulatus TaxID=241271 RepID=UPI001BD4125F|nr:uncharacterized protein LOC121506022 [Cheilinus undulatus]XP_041637438.1 uncharacterized protein LOC121506022 [Cheilinus undulatus]